MTLLTWNHACTVGVRAMDDQHGILMDTMNELRMALMRGAGREQLSEVLDRLIEFTRMHFASEEQMLERSGFPGLAAHRSEHQRLLAQILEANHRALHGEKLQVRALLLILRDWYTVHIENVDKEYGPWLNERGVS